MDKNVIDTNTLALIEERLGRTPRGLRAVAVSDGAGAPMVLQVASIVDGKPFPTLYWLIDPELCLKIDRAEAGGLIAELQQVIDARPELQQRMRRDHEAHIALRNELMEPAEREAVEHCGFTAAFEARGIGGIADFSRIRCLHTWYAAHLVRANTVGVLLEDYWRAQASTSD